VSNALTKTNKKSLFARWLGPGAAERTETERARLEAFLTAFPGEYCGWAKDGSVAYSQGFCDLLGISGLKNLEDVQARLSPGDAAALEGLFDRMWADGTPFTIIVKSHDEQRTYKISASQGRDRNNRDAYNVLWLEDITEQSNAQTAFAAEAQQKDSDLTNMRAALNAIPRPMWMRDDQQKIIWCNETYAEFLNTTRDKVLKEQKEIAAQALKKKTAAKEKDELLPGPSLAKAALVSGKTLDTNIHSVVKGARNLLRIMEIPLTPLPLTIGIAYNNTREEELETDLKRYQSSNRELLGQLRTAIAIYSSDERLEFYNSAFAQLWDLDDQYLNTHPRLGDIMEKLRQTRHLPEQADFRRFKQSWLDMFTGLIDPYEDMLHLPDSSACAAGMRRWRESLV
jgi:PAS domain-containing protein